MQDLSIIHHLLKAHISQQPTIKTPSAYTSDATHYTLLNTLLFILSITPSSLSAKMHISSSTESAQKLDKSSHFSPHLSPHLKVGNHFPKR
jgi:hypothetical protein